MNKPIIKSNSIYFHSPGPEVLEPRVGQVKLADGVSTHQGHNGFSVGLPIFVCGRLTELEYINQGKDQNCETLVQLSVVFFILYMGRISCL